MNKVAIYGLSTETERVLKEWDGKYNVIGLLDGFKTSGKMFGYPIISVDEAVKFDDLRIVVVARPGSCKAITKKIGPLCKAHDVELFDIRGKNLLEENRVVYDFQNVEGYTRSEYMQIAKEHDAISFDLFDTLVVRMISSFEDIISLTEDKLKEMGTPIDEFVAKRIAAEKAISQGAAPTLIQIYDHMSASGFKSYDYRLPPVQLASLEFEIDLSLIKPREDMISFFNELYDSGKEIFITTDTYYSREQIKLILKKCKIKIKDENIIISCENNFGKKDGLFNIIKEYLGTTSILHIGDDQLVDVDSANKYGIDGIKIYSTIELMDMLGGLGLSDFDGDLNERLRIGAFAARLFNSPFQFENDERKLSVYSAYDIGYLFCAPIIYDFTKWFGKNILKNRLCNILFCARDGYLVKKIFEMLFPELEAKYFLTSRISAIRAGMEDENDIRYVDSMKFSGTLDENLLVRFGIDVNQVDNTYVDHNAEGLLKYSQTILEQSRIKKANNIRYINSLEMKDGSIAFFDFVAKGTSQLFLEKLLGRKVKGLYFLQLEPEFMKDKGLDIVPFYNEIERETSGIFDSYYFLETILTSLYPSVDEFDEDGNPVYSKETRTDKDIACFMDAQQGILDYVNDMRRLVKLYDVNKKLDEVMLLLLQKISIEDEDFLGLNVEDPFFNRNTNITDVI